MRPDAATAAERVVSQEGSQALAEAARGAPLTSATLAPITCARCLAVHEPPRLLRALKVCPECGHHLRLTARERLGFLVDVGTFIEWDEALASADPLGFIDAIPYPQRLQESEAKTGERDAVVTGYAALRGRPIAIGVFEFGFMGGSMGSVVGEKIFRLFARAGERRLPVLVVSASGGARMQEGIIALMQMAKVVVEIDRFHERRLPYVSLLTDPTTGGVAASLAMLGDVLLAEPGAQIGFAGPRVIEQTIRAPLPQGFQRAEHLLERGLIDAVVPRPQLRPCIYDVLRALSPARSRR